MNPAIADDRDHRARILLVAVCLLFTILGLRLFYLQITTFADYARDSDQNRIAQKRIKAPRGLVFARHGEVLARNRAFYTITLERSTRHEYEETVAAVRAALGDSAIDAQYSRRQRFIRLKRDVDFRTVSVVEERLRGAYPALGIEIEAQRYYPHGNTCAHLLGYMGLVHEDELTSARGRAYAPGDFIGKTGLEKLHEDALRGTDGVRFLEVDADGRTRREFPEREQRAAPGRDLHLTIDLAVQQAVEAAMPDSLAGAVVALDPRNGALLALVSKPDFDPNVFVSFQAQRQRQEVLQSETALLNRAVQGLYPPGSTLKMVAAVAALEEAITDTLSTFEACSGSLQVGDVVFHCLRRDGHGELNLVQALEVSCNVYFYHLAQLLGVDTWWRYADAFGLGRATGFRVEPPESAGLLPSKAYYAARDGWTLGHLMNLVIGQDALLVTPLQMARYTAAIANGGYLVVPHVIGPPAPPQRIPDVSARTLALVRTAMERVVQGREGTGHRAAIPGISVAGKSGTAQGPRADDDAWFVAFAPMEAPTIAIAVVVEGGGGGGAVAAPVVRAALQAYFRIGSPADQQAALPDRRPAAAAAARPGSAWGHP